MFEPVHGSAPPLAGRNIANPVGAILSVALLLDSLGLTVEAAAVESAVKQAVTNRQVTSDVGGSLGTNAAGDYISKRVEADVH
jgi:3-isopropylmalate dehydrogenase